MGRRGMADDTAQRVMDAEEHRRTYEAVMKVSGEIAVPFCLALCAMFTNLVMRNGLGVALVAGVITYLIAFFVVRTFFSH
jgi:threonine/homoserine efflux transporter RhtA